MALTKLTQSLIDGTLVTSVNGNTGAVTTGIDLQSSVKTADFTAVANEGYLVNTTSSAITVTLPSSPSLGDEVLIIDYAGTFGTNNVTLTSSDNIQGASNDRAVKKNNNSVKLIYSDATKGWLVGSASETDSIGSALPSSFTVDYLVVAGGGPGGDGNDSGGGGAGGLRTSYGSTSGGGASAETSLSLSSATNYTVTVGAGGSGGSSTNGYDSTFSTITSNGGGAGGDNNTSNYDGLSGGSGGGGDNDAGAGGSGTAGQGYAGGDGGGTNVEGGGGGGAGAAGASASSGSSAGGAGLAVNILSATNAAIESVGEISGSDVYFAGGGGGGGETHPASGNADGGIGGGADGTTGTTGNNATPNTGGGGGSVDNVGTGGSGGSGIIILRYPNNYTITETTSPAVLTFNTYTEGSYKVTVFKSGNGTIQFS